MSWFNRRPKIREPLKYTPHTSSPMTEKKLDEAKETRPESKKLITKRKK